MRGQLWENLVFGELVKTHGLVPGRTLFFYRDQNGVEVDFLADRGAEVVLIEAKAAELPDERKLSIAMVAKLLAPRVRVHGVVACTTPERSPVRGEHVTWVNPLYAECLPTAACN